MREGRYNLRKRRKTTHDNLVDRISYLPHEILVTILSLLPLKEAASTSILSRQWQYLWTSTMNLNFDDEDTLCRTAKPPGGEAQELANLRYVNWVNSVVEQHRGPKVEQFRVSFHLDKRSSGSIDKWIRFAMKKGVQMLDIDFLEYGFHQSYTLFPHQVFDFKQGSAWRPFCFEVPNLDPCMYTGFKSLKDLCFKNVDVAEEVLQYFLSNCPVLERLSVYNSRYVSHLRVVGTSIALKYLEIRECFMMESIEIRDANLVSFTYAGHTMINLLIMNVPRLVDVSICEPNNLFFEVVFTQLSYCLSQLETLNLTYNVLFRCDRIFPTMPNLRHLGLIFEGDDAFALVNLTYFLQACPCLHKLVLQMHYEGLLKSFARAPKFSHNSLKVVEMVGYVGCTSDFALVRYLIKTAVNLEKIVVNPVQTWLLQSLNYRIMKDQILKWQENVRDRARKYFKRRVPKGIEFVCL
ncbi:F-box/LRR-repeat protein [Prunus yedoensis var. nudiflora]|uniref:F-box/LRR-repeat protein n=1 Tax=Prunus yedoensis var. nudiflora TaxID=2094558 RepID=A0A314UGQ4_PRUYE|nr:F-box/LRR-repeat protein [Prunus yedoensis var. nudiflora]